MQTLVCIFLLWWLAGSTTLLCVALELCARMYVCMYVWSVPLGKISVFVYR